MLSKRILAIFLIAAAAIGVIYLHEDSQKKTEATPIKSAESEAKKAPLESNNNTESNQNPDAIRDFQGLDLMYNDHGIPVLMYHSVSNRKGSKLFMPVEKFTQQMKYLKDNDYVTLTTEEVFSFFKNNTPIPEKSVLIRGC